MRRAKTTTLLSGLLLAAALAGCIGDDGEELDPAALQAEGIQVTVTPESGDADTVFTFDASQTPGADALTFLWDFGDGETATGKVVEHTFAYTNNLYEVEVQATDGNATLAERTIEIPVGSGQNAAPHVTIESERKWVAHDDPLTVRASTHDGDGDPVEIEWLLTKDQSADDGHDHDHGGAGGGSGFGIPDSTGKTGPEATFAFNESGTYRIVAKATDPKGAKATSQLDVKVTHTVPKPTFTLQEANTLTAGTGGAGASLALYEIQQPSENTYVDSALYSFRLVYPGTGNFSLDWSAAAPGADIDAVLYDDAGKTVEALDTLDPTATSESTSIELSKGSYVIEIKANTGAQIDYTVTVDLDLIIPGLTVFPEGGDGHGGHEH